jgi:ankyrin repeat protein
MIVRDPGRSVPEVRSIMVFRATANGVMEISVKLWTILGFVAICFTAAGCTTTQRPVSIIHVAMSKGDTAMVKQAAEDQTQINALNEYGETPLLRAINGTDSELAAYLIRQGADVNLRNPNTGESPLIAAAKNRDEGLVRQLVQSGARVDTTDNEKLTPLIWACRKGHVANVKALIGSSGRMKVTKMGRTIIEASSFGNTPVVGLLLTTGIDVESRTSRGETSLILASRFGHEETVRFLLKNGAAIDAVDMSGATALVWAAKMGEASVVRLLLDFDAEKDRRDSTEHTPMAYSVRFGHLDAFRELMASGAALDFKGWNGESLMYWAAFRDDISEMLYASGATVEKVKEGVEESIVTASRYLWLARYYEDKMKSGPGEDDALITNMTDCYQWASDYYLKAASDYENLAVMYEKRQSSISTRNFLLNVLSASAALMQANVQARQTAQLSALKNPGSPATGYGTATYPVLETSIKTFEGRIKACRKKAESCRLTSRACADVADCYRHDAPRSPKAASCAAVAAAGILQLK